MQGILKKCANALIAIVLVFLLIGLVDNVNAADYSDVKELFLLNEAGGVIAVTQEPCLDPVAKSKGFEYRGYATEKNGTLHEGCWTAPDTSDAPKIPNVIIIPIINMYFDGETIMVPQNQFKPLAAFKDAL